MKKQVFSDVTPTVYPDAATYVQREDVSLLIVFSVTAVVLLYALTTACVQMVRHYRRRP